MVARAPWSPSDPGGARRAGRRASERPGAPARLGGRGIRVMRYESSITSLSWIPSEAVTGGHQAGLRRRSRPLRPAAARGDRGHRGAPRRRSLPVRQRPRAWIEVGAAGEITDAGYGRRRPDRLHHRPAAGLRTFEAVGLPDLQRATRSKDGSAGSCRPWRPHRAAGAAAGASRPVHPVAGAAGVDDPGADDPRRREGRGRADRGEPLPRHWVYDADGQLSHKSGLADFKDWSGKSFGGTARGATRTQRRWSPRSRRRWSARSPGS